MSHSRRIVVPVDFSTHSREAALVACELARASGSSVHLVHAVKPPVVMAQEFAYPSDFWQVLREAATKRMDELCEVLSSEGVAITTDLVEMEAVATICVESNNEDVDLVVMGTHGYTGWKHAFLGSVTERTLRTISKPVLAVKHVEGKEEAREPIRKILVATDFSADSDVAMQAALEWAKHLGAEVELLHVVPEPATLLAAYSVPGGPELLQNMRDAGTEKLAELHERAESTGVTVSSRLDGGDASEGIARRAEEIGAQVIAIGTRGNTGLKHVFLGSVAERVLRLAHCSVLVASNKSRD